MPTDPLDRPREGADFRIMPFAVVDGLPTFELAAKYLEAEAQRLRRLHELGWRPVDPIDDRGYGTLTRRGAVSQ